MGPIAGIGDTIIWGTAKAIILALGCTFALQGNIIGAFIPFFISSFWVYTWLVFLEIWISCRKRRSDEIDEIRYD